MWGIYIHVPYCKHKCDYCDFYSVESGNRISDFEHLIGKELVLRHSYLPHGAIDTIYFGGGTPSLMAPAQIERILSEIATRYTLSTNPEITLEANPDDLNRDRLKVFRDLGINRLSIGVQSFNDYDLNKLERRHTAAQAIQSVEEAQLVGFKDISIDLIYGLPYSSNEVWQRNLMQAFALPINHLSCYHLIVEEGTPLSRSVRRGDVIPVSEEVSVVQFHALRELAKQNGFIHYEISNFAKEGCFSRHNSSYWNGKPYLGLGPSAHSYSGTTRDWNPRSIAQWASAVEEGLVATQGEVLTPKDQLNDLLLTSLRTIWGLNLGLVSEQFGDKVAQKIIKNAQKYIEHGVITQSHNVLSIAPQHFFISDGIISDFLEV